MQDFRNVGINPDYDHLYDPQQRPPQSVWPPKCGCCGDDLAPGDRFWELHVLGRPLIVCRSCKGIMEINEGIVEA